MGSYHIYWVRGAFGGMGPVGPFRREHFRTGEIRILEHGRPCSRPAHRLLTPVLIGRATRCGRCHSARRRFRTSACRSTRSSSQLFRCIRAGLVQRTASQGQPGSPWAGGTRGHADSGPCCAASYRSSRKSTESGRTNRQRPRRAVGPVLPPLTPQDPAIDAVCPSSIPPT